VAAGDGGGTESLSAALHQEEAMSLLDILLLVVSGFLLVYLAYALLRPEKF
jgi:K+-transporting ATPase KdpF subunit